MNDYSQLKFLKMKKSQPLHPYFTSQSIDVIKKYISFFTKEGDVVLDPFCGTGTVGIAASMENRKSILFDLSPFAVFISKRSLEKINVEKTKNNFKYIKNTISNKINETYLNEFQKKPQKYPNVIFPTSSDAKNMQELFTSRNLYNLNRLLDIINSTNDETSKKFFLFIFSGILHRASKTFFYDKAKWGGGNSSIFTKYRYWIPKTPDERNVWELFEIRFKRVLKIKEKIQSELKQKSSIQHGSATKLTKIKDNSVDYVYTDPPYGANIAYLDLSLMWNAWLNLDNKFKKSEEAIEGGSEHLSKENYLKIMGESFKEIYRVLKPQKYLSLVFQHKDPKLWYDIIEQCEQQGFKYVNAFSYGSHYKSYHKTSNPLNVVSGYMIINFKKSVGKSKIHQSKLDIKNIVDEIIGDLQKNDNSTIENIVTLLVPKMLEKKINPKNFNLMDYLKESYSFSNDEKWRAKPELNKNSEKSKSKRNSEKSKFETIIIYPDLPADFSEEEAKNKIDELFDYAINSLDENGVIWVVTTDIRNNTKFVPVSMIVLESALNKDLLNFNSIIWLHENEFGNGPFSNIYSNIMMFSKSSNYHFDKDGIREKHIWKNVEWGNRKFRYNEKGKDPGNVWIKNTDDGQGKIIEQKYYTKKEIMERLFSLTSKENNNLLLTNHCNLKSKNYKIKIFEIVTCKNSKTKKRIKPLLKKQNTNQEIKIFFKSSEKMDNVNNNSIKLIITSPPYWNLKDYKNKNQIGFKEDYKTFNKRLESVWKECFRVLDIDGTMWINVNSRIAKDQVYLLQKDIFDIAKKIGFKLIDILIWHKSSGIPVSTKRLKDNFEYVLIFAKNLPTTRLNSEIKFFDYKTKTHIQTCTNVWNLNRFTGSIGKKFEHPAIYPDELVERAIQVCTSEGQSVLDPFLGSGTTALVCANENRKFIGFELNKNFKKLIDHRMKQKIGELTFFSANVQYDED